MSNTRVLWPQSSDGAPSDGLTANGTDVNAGLLARRIVGVLGVIGYFCSMFIESLVSNLNGDWSPVRQAAYLAGHLDMARTQITFEFLTPLFLIAMIFSLLGVIRSRGVWLASVGGVLGVLGALALTAGAASHLVVFVMLESGAPASAAAAALAAPLPDLLFYLFFAPFAAFILLAAAAWRARLVTWIPFVAVCVFVALDLVGLLPEIVPLALGLLAFCVIAVRLVRATIPAPIGDARRAALDKMYESQQSGGDRTQV